MGEAIFLRHVLNVYLHGKVSHKAYPLDSTVLDKTAVTSADHPSISKTDILVVLRKRGKKEPSSHEELYSPVLVSVDHIKLCPCVPLSRVFSGTPILG